MASFGPHEREFLAFLDELARFPMTRLPDLLARGRGRDATAVGVARRSVTRLAASSASRAAALREADEPLRRWVDALASVGGLRTPSYNTWPSALEARDVADAAAIVRDAAAAILLGDLLLPEDREALASGWDAVRDPG